MIISKTPLRISFLGGGTDLESFYKNNSYGCVISSAIDSYIYIVLKKHNKIFDEKYRLNYSITENVKKISDIKNPIIRECVNYSNIQENLYISSIADAPSNSGLGSSSAFCVGLLNCLYKYKKQKIKPSKLAEIAAKIEINILKKPIGKQDHYPAALGGFNYYKFLKNDRVISKKIDINNKEINNIFDNLLTFWTGKTRDAEKVLKEQNKNYKKNNNNLNEIKKITDLTFLDYRKKNMNISLLGNAIHNSWILKKQLAKNISYPKINYLYNLALKEGAYGGKISGAGAGGFLNLIVPKKKQAKVINLMKKNGLIKYDLKYEKFGSRVLEIS
tara:strand:+ start:25507 stop:26499 length:993 start_codon:yes stop_codon:yes gene_type:complete